MAGSRKETNPLKTLSVLLIVFAILCGLAFFGYTILRGSANSDYLRRQAVVDEQNEQLKAEYHQKIAEAKANQTLPLDVNEWPTPRGEGWEVLDVSNCEVGATRPESVSRDTLLLGGLFLINRWHTLPSDYPSTGYVSIGNHTDGGVPVKDYNVTLATVAADALLSFVKGAKEEAGLESYIVQQGYRDMANQTTLYQAEVDKLAKTYNGDVLYDKAAERVSRPGTGEYQTGLSFQMGVYGSTDDVRGKSLQETAQGAWLNQNGWRFGFVFRFPTFGYPTGQTTDKTYKTGESRKMDIYRYVGVGNATAMYAMDMCLEEYIEYLMNHPHIAVYENGALRYEIYRVAAADAYTVSVPVLTSAVGYTASLDNMGGLVVCAQH